MRVVKEAEERRNEILDAAEELFIVDGYEKTSVQGIIDKIGIAKGTFYYYFKSKEELLNGIVDRYNSIILRRAAVIAENKELGCVQRFMGVIGAMQISQEINSALMEQLHTSQNLLLHQKIMSSMLAQLTPILVSIVEEGIALGIFQTKFPREHVEMLLIYGLTIFDGDIVELAENEKQKRMGALVAAGELLLGAEPGCFFD